MRCEILGCDNRTLSINRLCLEHECMVWAKVNGCLNGGQTAKSERDEPAAQAPCPAKHAESGDTIWDEPSHGDNVNPLNGKPFRVLKTRGDRNDRCQRVETYRSKGR